MRRLVFAAGISLAAGWVHAQPATPSLAPASTGLVVGSGIAYTAVVADLEEAVAFYRDGIGFEFQGEPADAAQNPQLRAALGVRDGRLRWQTGQAPGIPGGVQIVEISSRGGQRLDRRIQDPSVAMLMVVVRDIRATLARLTALGAPVVTRGGGPVSISPGLRAVIVQDPAGHFVELLEPSNPPRTQRGSGEIRNVQVRHTVDHLDRAVALYRDALGLQGRPVPPGYYSAPRVIDLLGVPRNTRWRYTTLHVPSSGLPIELIEFEGGRRRLWPNVTIVDLPASGAELEADRPPLLPGDTQIQLRVTDIDAAIAALAQAGGTFVSPGGKPLELAAESGVLEVGVVRDPDGLFVMLVAAPPQ